MAPVTYSCNLRKLLLAWPWVHRLRLDSSVVARDGTAVITAGQHSEIANAKFDVAVVPCTCFWRLLVTEENM
eukprot:4138177-Pleurochrysis_carterae.AAC.1